MNIRTTRFSLIFVTSAVLIVGLVGINSVVAVRKLLQENDATDQTSTSVAPAAQSTQVNLTVSGLDHDLAESPNYWLTGPLATLSFSNPTRFSRRLQIVLRNSQTPCGDAMDLVVLRPGQTWKLRGSKSPSVEWTGTIKGGQSTTFVVQSTSSPCLIESDPRLFFGALAIVYK